MIQQAIDNLKTEHCGVCKIHAAIVALEAITSQTPAASVQPAVPVMATRIAEPVRSQKPKSNGHAQGDPKARTEKACKKCMVTKPLSAFIENKACSDGHEGTCKACRAELNKKAYQMKFGKGEQVQAPTAAAPTPKLDGKHACDECHAIFSGPIQLRQHRELKHSA